MTKVQATASGGKPSPDRPDLRPASRPGRAVRPQGRRGAGEPGAERRPGRPPRAPPTGAAPLRASATARRQGARGRPRAPVSGPWAGLPPGPPRRPLVRRHARAAGPGCRLRLGRPAPPAGARAAAWSAVRARNRRPRSGGAEARP